VCRLAMKTAETPFSPYSILTSMEAMKEGYDGSGIGLLLRGIEFAEFKQGENDPILSGIAHTEEAWYRLMDIMEGKGFKIKYDHEYDIDPELFDPANRYKYLLRVYKLPKAWRDYDQKKIDLELMKTRLELREDGEAHGGDLTIFSFWPDVISIKEVGWPLDAGKVLRLDDDRIKARIVMAQGRQNTNYGINLYACHPFFIEGVASMTNGENTAFVPIKEWLIGTGFPGYSGYQSDSEVFAHILHYVTKKLDLPLEAYKHVITPLSTGELAKHPQGDFLKGLREVCRRFIIDGPNCVMASMPDETSMMVMDHKKMRPAAIGGKPGEWAMASEMCGLEAMIPDRDPIYDFQPMRDHTIIVPSHRKEYKIWSQFDPFPLPQVA